MKKKYSSLLNELSLNMNPGAMTCNKGFCDDQGHTSEIDYLYSDIIDYIGLVYEVSPPSRSELNYRVISG